MSGSQLRSGEGPAEAAAPPRLSISQGLLPVDLEMSHAECPDPLCSPQSSHHPLGHTGALLSSPRPRPQQPSPPEPLLLTPSPPQA